MSGSAEPAASSTGWQFSPIGAHTIHHGQLAASRRSASHSREARVSRKCRGLWRSLRVRRLSRTWRTRGVPRTSSKRPHPWDRQVYRPHLRIPAPDRPPAAMGIPASLRSWRSAPTGAVTHPVHSSCRACAPPEVGAFPVIRQTNELVLRCHYEAARRLTAAMSQGIAQCLSRDRITSS